MAVPARLRTLREFAESEIIVPDGPFKGRPFRVKRQPFVGLWFDAVQSGNWNRYAVVGPTQTGKTLVAYVIIVLYHAFEVCEKVICGVPDMSMANEKWAEDLRPTIEASPNLAKSLPTRGEGSKGGRVKGLVQLTNGGSIKFMAGGGGDSQRSGYTSRVLAVTEVDKMDESGEESRETDKISQMIARTDAFGKAVSQRPAIYLECTVSVEFGRIWQEYSKGTASRIARPCWACGEFVTPEREHLVGWFDAENVRQAEDEAHFICPSCGERWTDEQRFTANADGVLLHRGQTIDKRGRIHGDPPETDTLGFRWSAVDNHLKTAGEVGARAWRASRSEDQENAEREIRQFAFVIPYEPPDVDIAPLRVEQLQKRMRKYKRGEVPEKTHCLVLTIDTGSRRCHWAAQAWRLVDSKVAGHVIDYGEFEVERGAMTLQAGLLRAFESFTEFVFAGYRMVDTGAVRVPDLVLIDSGYHEHKTAVYSWCAACNAMPEAQRARATRLPMFIPAKGYGASQQRYGRAEPYRHPTKRGKKDRRIIAEQYWLNTLPDAGVRGQVVGRLAHINSDYWKTQAHDRLGLPDDESGALTLFADPSGHTDWARQVTAEKQVEIYKPGVGELIVWDRMRRNNHHCDTTYMGVAGAHMCGVRIIGATQPPREPTKTIRRRRGIKKPDGRALVSKRRKETDK